MVYGVSNPIRFNMVGEVIGLEPMECELLTNLKREKRKVYGTYLEMIVQQRKIYVRTSTSPEV
jgi:hypothetical protein